MNHNWKNFPYRKYILLFIAITVCLSVNGRDKINVIPYPVIQGAVKSTAFKVTADGKDIFTEKFKDINYTHFAHKKRVSLVVTSSQPIVSWTISPKENINKVKLEGNKIKFTQEKPGYHVLTINNEERLFILTDKPSNNAPKINTPGVIDIMQYNADNTGKKVSTKEIQKALDDAAEQKKILVFSPGIYKTGTIRISSNARIYLPAGAMIKGSEKREDYPSDDGRKESDHINDKANYTDNGEWMTFSRLLLVDNAKDVKIWGDGTIDGSGSIVRAQGKPANLIRIRNSKDVEIDGLVLRDPASWNTHILKSENVTIRNIKMLNDRDVPNTDGFDPDASKNVLIENCFAYCSDDNIAIKTTNNGNLLQDCEDITVRNCVFLTKKSSLKVGTETKGATMRNITFENNYVVEADRGLALYCMDGARFENIRFINNYIESNFPDNQQKGIHFQIRKRSGEGYIKNVLIKDCSFGAAFPRGAEMMGLDAAHLIDGVTFKNLKIAGELCLSADKLGLKTNEFVKNIKFEK